MLQLQFPYSSGLGRTSSVRQAVPPHGTGLSPRYSHRPGSKSALPPQNFTGSDSTLLARVVSGCSSQGGSKQVRNEHGALMASYACAAAPKPPRELVSIQCRQLNKAAQ